MGTTFRENLRNELAFQGIIVKELSFKTGIPVATLDCYLGARATIPSAEAAVKIAQVLGVTTEYLVIGEEAEEREKPRADVCPEARELIRHIEQLDSKQCKAILRLIEAFNKEACK